MTTTRMPQAAGHGGSALHQVASAELADHPMPNGREEDWRFTPLELVLDLLDGADPVPAPALETTADGVSLCVVDRRGPAGWALVGSSGYLPHDRVSAVAWHRASQVVSVAFADHMAVAEPVVVRMSEAQGTTSALHTVIRAGVGSRGSVVLDYRGAGRHSGNVEVLAEDAADLTIVAIHDQGPAAVHCAHHHLSVGRDAHVRHGVVTLGGALVRLTASVSYASVGGRADLVGLYVADSGQHHEHRLFVDHATPRSVSDVLYKGALLGSTARTVWVGDVLIRPTAIGITTYEMNRNLILVDGARADSVPNLEIETGDIEGAGHASATGRFDDEQLFYLTSRGIDPQEARRLVLRGYFAELIGRLGVPSLTARLLEAVDAELEGVVA